MRGTLEHARHDYLLWLPSNDLAVIFASQSALFPPSANICMSSALFVRSRRCPDLLTCLAESRGKNESSAERESLTSVTAKNHDDNMSEWMSQNKQSRPDFSIHDNNALQQVGEGSARVPFALLGSGLTNISSTFPRTKQTSSKVSHGISTPATQRNFRSNTTLSLSLAEMTELPVLIKQMSPSIGHVRRRGQRKKSLMLECILCTI